jgi:hypothetical protein
LPAGLSGTSNDTIITITAASADTYPAGSISVQAASSCGAGTRRPSEQAVTVYESPAAPTGATANSRCGSGEVTFSATVPGGITIDWYTANTGGSIVSGGEGVTSFSPSLSATTTYYAQARNMTTNCTSASRLAVTGTVNAIPAEPTDPVHASRCGAGNVEIGATVPAGVTIDWYNDATGGMPFATDNATIIVSATSSFATYYAQARNTTSGCVSATRLPVTVTVDPVVAQATITGYSSNSCPTTTVSLTATATGAIGYIWYKDGTEVQSGTSSSYTVSSTGNYTVVGYNASCSGATSTAKYVSITPCSYLVPGCPFSVTTPLSYDAIDITWDVANTTCAQLGARLPSRSELQCLCNSGSTLNTLSRIYWTSEPHSTDHLYLVSSEDCSVSYAHKGLFFRARCVK